ncbi:MAG: hypothetical protein HOW73_11090 [Polyangiaceae bacterium]|nr:hypothetical protein [Polyangiaceae bacterium]
MAYLNVRQRRIEAKIAYVGPATAGKGTNLERLRGTVSDPRIGKIESPGDGASNLVSLTWQPPESGRFRDCDVHVQVVAHHGAFGREAFEALDDADGVVVVVDAHPSAQERNRISFDAVRTALERVDRADVPVLLQINKTDLPEALAAEDIALGLGAEGARHVVAAAAQGRGVVETLDAALNEVLAALRAEAEPDDERAPDTNRPPKSVSPNDSAHPLLAALRQVLRETVREHVDELETRRTARLQASLVRIEQRLAAVEARSVVLSTQLETLHRSSQADELHALHMEVRDAFAEAGARSNALRSRIDEIAEKLRKQKTGWFT